MPPDLDSLPIALCKDKHTFTSHPISQFVSYCHSDHSVFGKFSEAVLKFGLRRHSDHSVFSHTSTRGKILLIVYVDDIIIIDDKKGIDDLRDTFKTLNYFLGIEVA